jgi:hypothetical protein
MSETSSTFNWYSLPNHGTMVKLSREEIVKKKRRFDAGKSRELNPATAKLLKKIKLQNYTVYEKYKRNEIATIEMINKKLFEMDFHLTGDTLKSWLKKTLI